MNRLTSSLSLPEIGDAFLFLMALGSFPSWPEVLARVVLTLVVRETLLSRHLAVSDDARLEVVDDVIDLFLAQHSRSRL
jgi:hypothetical protein